MTDQTNYRLWWTIIIGGFIIVLIVGLQQRGEADREYANFLRQHPELTNPDTPRRVMEQVLREQEKQEQACREDASKCTDRTLDVPPDDDDHDDPTARFTE